MTRYRLPWGEYQEMITAQHGLCAICREAMIRPKVDHDHVTGKVRGLLCHRCNLRLSGIEDAQFMEKALNYLGLM